MRVPKQHRAPLRIVHIEGRSYTVRVLDRNGDRLTVPRFETFFRRGKRRPIHWKTPTE